MEEFIKKNIIPIAIIILAIVYFIFIVNKTNKDSFKAHKNKKKENDNIDENIKYQKTPLSPYFYYTKFLEDKIRLNTENNKKILNRNLLNDKNYLNINYLIPSQNYMQMRV